MDPLSQGTLGASAAQSASKTTQVVAGILGFLAGLTPDLDVFIRSSTDPLLFLDYHRQFTHSLIFIPIGGLLCGVVFYTLLRPWLVKKHNISLKQSILFCTLGYATHALLDSCTSYGTQLLWPFSNKRFAWNNISIIDPLFTLPMLGLVITAAVRKRPVYARAALIWGLLYLMVGVSQRERAVQMGWEIATQRGHQPIRVETKPSLGNLLLWKVIYETQDKFYVDAARIGINKTLFEGSSIAKLNTERDFPWLTESSQQAIDIARFSWFSDGYVAKDPTRPNQIMDVRYSAVPNEITPLWSIELNPTATNIQHVRYIMNREVPPERIEAFKKMLFD